MSVKLKILSWNWHEPYLTMIAKTGHDIHIVEPDQGRIGGAQVERPYPAETR